MTTNYKLAYPEASQDLKRAHEIHRKNGKTYFFATRLFPAHIKHATSIIYAWMRIPDDWVDSRSLSVKKKETLLESWSESWRQARQGGVTNHPIQKLALLVFEEYEIPLEWDQAFLSAMKQDLHKDRYANYEELEKYMYGSAAVVGLIMTKIIGHEEGALYYAETNGYAMQLTNFLRDVGEDWKDRGRIYLPQDIMKKFGVTDLMIAKGEITPEFSSLMKELVHKAKSLYTKAEPGISMLHKQGRKPVLLASKLYARILDKIEDNAYDVFTKRAHTSLREKITTGAKILIHD